MTQALAWRRQLRLYGAQRLDDTALLDLMADGPVGAALYRDGGGLAALATLGLPEMRALGLTERAAARLVAAFELGRRATLPARERRPIESPEDAYAWLAPHLKFQPRERFIVMVLDTRNRPCHVCCVAEGGVNRCPVNAREVFAPAIKALGASIIVGHNHPSGVSDPSAEDIVLTGRLVQAGELLGIPLLDHLIVAGAGFISLASTGALDPEAAQLAGDRDQDVAETPTTLGLPNTRD